ncbi:MAG: FKBP-type peptidyl-prolyl cis-trans isomerase [Anaerolineae bacterium]|nr:FKBP-type peptidyl-prolyl cis-trans isomerase [Anaerolineae bacterium]
MVGMTHGIKCVNVRIGTGASAEKGKTVTIHYRGYLNKGDLFRSSYDEGHPIALRIGSRDMIAGLEQGVIGMQVGGIRKLTISPRLAYRDQGVPGMIPPNAVLRFEVELFAVQD